MSKSNIFAEKHFPKAWQENIFNTCSSLLLNNRGMLKECSIHKCSLSYFFPSHWLIIPILSSRSLKVWMLYVLNRPMWKVKLTTWFVAMYRFEPISKSNLLTNHTKPSHWLSFSIPFLSLSRLHTNALQMVGIRKIVFQLVFRCILYAYTIHYR